VSLLTPLPHVDFKGGIITRVLGEEDRGDSVSALLITHISFWSVSSSLSHIMLLHQIHNHLILCLIVCFLPWLLFPVRTQPTTNKATMEKGVRRGRSKEAFSTKPLHFQPFPNK